MTNLCSKKGERQMGQASRTTTLLLDLGKRTQGGANSEKRAALAATVEVLNAARAFYIDFFLAHADKLSEQVTYYSQEHLEWREGLISANALLTWAESATVATAAHPSPWISRRSISKMPLCASTSTPERTGDGCTTRSALLAIWCSDWGKPTGSVEALPWSCDPMRQSCISPRSGGSKPARS